MDRTQEAFADFQPTAITDGGYLGRMQAVENQENHSFCLIKPGKKI